MAAGGGRERERETVYLVNRKARSREVELDEVCGRCERSLSSVPRSTEKDKEARRKKMKGDHRDRTRRGEGKEEETWSRRRIPYTTRNENIPASFGLLSAIKRIPPVQPRINRVPGPKQIRIRSTVSARKVRATIHVVFEDVGSESAIWFSPGRHVVFTFYNSGLISLVNCWF